MVHSPTVRKESKKDQCLITSAERFAEVASAAAKGNMKDGALMDFGIILVNMMRASPGLLSTLTKALEMTGRQSLSEVASRITGGGANASSRDLLPLPLVHLSVEDMRDIYYSHKICLHGEFQGMWEKAEEHCRRRLVGVQAWVECTIILTLCMVE